MNKVMEAFKANKNEKTAAKLLAYLRKHPMTMCYMTQEEFELQKEALEY
jgi:hypothetical protein